jgi:hypothetical protein
MGGRPCDAHAARRCCRATTSTNCCCACWRATTRTPAVRHLRRRWWSVLATEHAEACRWCCARSSCCCCARPALLPLLDAQTLTLAPLEPEGRYSLVTEGGLRPCPAERTPACRAPVAGLQRPWTTGGGHAPRCCAPARRWPVNSSRSCAPCSITIAGCHAAHAPDDDGPAIAMTSSPHRPVRQPQQGGAGAQHAPPGHSQRDPRGRCCACRRVRRASPCTRGRMRATSAPRRARTGRTAEGLARPRVQHRRQSPRRT